MQAVGMEGSGKVTVLRTGKRTRYAKCDDDLNK